MKGQPCSGDPRRRDPCGAQAKTPSRPWEEPRIDYGFTQAVDRDTAVLISPVLVVVLVVVGSRVATPSPGASMVPLFYTSERWIVCSTALGTPVFGVDLDAWWRREP